MAEDPRPIAVSLLGEPSPADGIALIVGPVGGSSSVVRLEYPMTIVDPSSVALIRELQARDTWRA